MSNRQAPAPRVRLTARGAIAVVFVATLAGEAPAALTGIPALAGIAFIAGCLAAALLVNQRDLLSLVVTPPLVFFSATLLIEIAAAIGAASMLQALGIGMFEAMSAGAPWLFTGSALMLLISWRRGLVSNVRALRDDLRASRPGAKVPRPRVGETAFAPEPEGYFEPRLYGSQRDGTEPGVTARHDHAE